MDLEAKLNNCVEVLRVIANRVEGATQIEERMELADLANECLVQVGADE
jgi:hypothetical protein